MKLYVVSFCAVHRLSISNRTALGTALVSASDYAEACQVADVIMNQKFPVTDGWQDHLMQVTKINEIGITKGASQKGLDG